MKISMHLFFGCLFGQRTPLWKVFRYVNYGSERVNLKSVICPNRKTSIYSKLNLKYNSFGKDQQILMINSLHGLRLQTLRVYSSVCFFTNLIYKAV